MNKKELNLLLTLTREKIISVNALYKAGIKRVAGRNIPYIYRDPKAAVIESEIRDQLKAIDFSEHLDFFRRTKYFSITISFILKANVMRRDVQNLDKCVIDILTKYIHEDLGVETFDDSLFLDVYFTKSIIPGASSEYIAVHVKESTHSVRFDILDEPKKVYCSDPDSVKIIKKKSKDLGLKIKYFSDPDKEYDSEIEFLSPEQSLGKELIRLSEKIIHVKSCDNRFLWVGIKGGQDTWGEKNYKLLEDAVTALTEVIGDCSRIKIGFINNPEEILEL